MRKKIRESLYPCCVGIAPRNCAVYTFMAKSTDCAQVFKTYYVSCTRIRMGGYAFIAIT